jgi:lipopolysaccharide export system ATP-binding protein
VSKKSTRSAKPSPTEPKAAAQRATREPVLRAEGLVKRYGRRTVVDHVALDVAPGEVVGLLGANGAGKTTTFGMLVGLVQPSEGRITFNGADVTRAPMHRRARAGLAYLAQEPSVFRDLTARENILAVLEFQPLDKKARHARADQLLEELDITRIASSRAEVLSGGERRRVEIARALATDPKVFLLDEPFAGIDPIALADLQRGVIALKQRGIGVLITDHNVRETLLITDRTYILSEGRVLISGTPAEIAASRAAREAYLGEGFRMDFTDASI